MRYEKAIVPKGHIRMLSYMVLQYKFALYSCMHSVKMGCFINSCFIETTLMCSDYQIHVFEKSTIGKIVKFYSELRTDRNESQILKSSQKWDPDEKGYSHVSWVSNNISNQLECPSQWYVGNGDENQHQSYKYSHKDGHVITVRAHRLQLQRFSLHNFNSFREYAVCI